MMPTVIGAHKKQEVGGENGTRKRTVLYGMKTQ